MDWFLYDRELLHEELNLENILSYHLRSAHLISPTHVFSCEYCEIFKNNFFYKTPLVAASEIFSRATQDN